MRALTVEANVWDGTWDEITLGDGSIRRVPRILPVSVRCGPDCADFRAGVIPLVATPEPAPLATLAAGALGIAALARRRRAAARG